MNIQEQVKVELERTKKRNELTEMIDISSSILNDETKEKENLERNIKEIENYINSGCSFYLFTIGKKGFNYIAFRSGGMLPLRTVYYLSNSEIKELFSKKDIKALNKLSNRVWTDCVLTPTMIKENRLEGFNIIKKESELYSYIVNKVVNMYKEKLIKVKDKIKSSNSLIETLQVRLKNVV